MEILGVRAPTGSCLKKRLVTVYGLWVGGWFQRDGSPGQISVPASFLLVVIKYLISMNLSRKIFWASWSEHGVHYEGKVMGLTVTAVGACSCLGRSEQASRRKMAGLSPCFYSFQDPSSPWDDVTQISG